MPQAIGRLSNTKVAIEAVAEGVFRKLAELRAPIAVKCTPSGAVYIDRPDRTAVPQLLVVVIDQAGPVRYRENHLEVDLLRHAKERGIITEMRTKVAS